MVEVACSNVNDTELIHIRRLVSPPGLCCWEPAQKPETG